LYFCSDDEFDEIWVMRSADLRCWFMSIHDADLMHVGAEFSHAPALLSDLWTQWGTQDAEVQDVSQSLSCHFLRKVSFNPSDSCWRFRQTEMSRGWCRTSASL